MGNNVAARGQDNHFKKLNFHKNSDLVCLSFVNIDNNIEIIVLLVGVLTIPT